MAALMPAVLVIIACKTVIAGPPDQNAGFTHSENRAWATENSMMVCRRHEIQLHDPSADMGAKERPFTPMACRMAAPMQWVQFDQAHRNTSYRAWRVACPTATINTITGEIIAWVLPPCPHRETVVCEVDSAI